MANDLPLDGVTLVEIIHPSAPVALQLAMGMCGRIAADLGASVTRLSARSGATCDPSANIFLNTGKRNLVVADDQFAAMAMSLVGSADAVCCDEDSLLGFGKLAEKRVTVALGMSADAWDAGTEFTVEARSGILTMVGDPTREPLRLGGHQTAYSAGLAAYLAVVSGLPELGQDGPIKTRFVNLLDVSVWLNWKGLGMTEWGAEPPLREGADAVWTTLPCKDGFFAAVYRPVDWLRLKEIFDDPRLHDSRFQSAEDRKTHVREVNALLADLFADMTRDEIHELSLKNRIPLGPVLAPADLLNSPHLRARGFLDQVETEEGLRKMPTVPVKWNGATMAPANAT
jgi:crotonobetainyl-CoA:carnitine CoA-transferase CaiB-like acyl-CoA transferase